MAEKRERVQMPTDTENTLTMLTWLLVEQPTQEGRTEHAHWVNHTLDKGGGAVRPLHFLHALLHCIHAFLRRTPHILAQDLWN